jgi:hypothetical protein
MGDRVRVEVTLGFINANMEDGKTSGMGCNPHG